MAEPQTEASVRCSSGGVDTVIAVSVYTLEWALTRYWNTLCIFMRSHYRQLCECVADTLIIVGVIEVPVRD